MWLYTRLFKSCMYVAFISPRRKVFAIPQLSPKGIFWCQNLGKLCIFFTKFDNFLQIALNLWTNMSVFIKILKTVVFGWTKQILGGYGVCWQWAIAYLWIWKLQIFLNPKLPSNPLSKRAQGSLPLTFFPCTMTFSGCKQMECSEPFQSASQDVFPQKKCGKWFDQHGSGMVQVQHTGEHLARK